MAAVEVRVEIAAGRIPAIAGRGRHLPDRVKGSTGMCVRWAKIALRQVLRLVAARVAVPEVVQEGAVVAKRSRPSSTPKLAKKAASKGVFEKFHMPSEGGGAGGLKVAATRPAPRRPPGDNESDGNDGKA